VETAADFVVVVSISTIKSGSATFTLPCWTTLLEFSVLITVGVFLKFFFFYYVSFFWTFSYFETKWLKMLRRIDALS
jgi:hypothetical protein